MLKRRIISIVLATVISAASIAAADDFDVQRERQQKEAEVAALPAVPPMRLRDAIIARIEKNDLAIYTRLPPTAAMSKLTINDLSGISTADVRIFAGGIAPKAPSDPYRPAMMNFVHWIFNEHAGTIAATSVLVSAFNLQIDHTVESAEGVSQVTFIQSNPGFDTSEAPVHLRIHTGDHPPIVRSARDLTSLRRSFPGDTSKYLEPIFREIGAEAIVFSADPRLAWQVFAAEAHPDAAVNEKLRMILPRLDSDDFHQRETASTDLQKLGEPGAICLWKIDRSKFSAEQNSRIDGFLKPFQPATESDVVRLRGDASFLLECLDEDDGFLVQTALGRLRQVSGHPISFDQSLRGEQRRAAIDALREHLIPPTTMPDDAR